MKNPTGHATQREGADVTTTYASPLTAADRCDRCGAQAYVRATMESGFDLLLCAHHFRENENRLREVAVSIYDESERLVQVPATVEER
jgi:ribosomal protein S14